MGRYPTKLAGHGLLLSTMVAFSTCYLPPPDKLLSDPLDCSGWPETRVYFEGQAWWTNADAEVNTESKHIHLGTCFPYNQTVSGILTLDAALLLHGEPGSSNASQLMAPTTISASMANSSLGKSSYSSGAWECTKFDEEGLAQNCEMAVRLQIDTHSVPNGLHWATLSASPFSIGEGGINNATSIKIMGPVWVDNGEDLHPIAAKANITHSVAFLGLLQDMVVQAKATAPWTYTFTGYHMDGLPVTSPDRPASGTLLLPTYLQTPGSKLRGNFTAAFVSIDPNFHGAEPDFGLVLADVSAADHSSGLCGQLSVWERHAGRRSEPELVAQSMVRRSSCATEVELDTRLLEDGWHKIFVRGDVFVAEDDPVFELLPNDTSRQPSDSPQVGGGTFSVASVVGLYVRNEAGIDGGSSGVARANETAADDMEEEGGEEEEDGGGELEDGSGSGSSAIENAGR